MKSKIKKKKKEEKGQLSSEERDTVGTHTDSALLH